MLIEVLGQPRELFLLANDPPTVHEDWMIKVVAEVRYRRTPPGLAHVHVPGSCGIIVGIREENLPCS